MVTGMCHHAGPALCALKVLRFLLGMNGYIDERIDGRKADRMEGRKERRDMGDGQKDGQTCLDKRNTQLLFFISCRVLFPSLCFLKNNQFFYYVLLL